MASFNLSEQLALLQDEPYELDSGGELDVPALDQAEVSAALEGAVESIAQDSNNVTDQRTFDVFRSLLKHAEHLTGPLLSKLLDSLNSGLAAEIDASTADLDSGDAALYASHRAPLEMYAFLLQWFVAVAERASKAGEGANGAGAAAGGKGKRGIKKTPAAGSRKNKETWAWAESIAPTLAVMSKALRLRTERIWTTTVEKDAFITCITKPAYQIAESETYMKANDVRLGIYKIVCLSVKHHGHAFGAQTSIMQNLQYYEHLSEPMAELLTILAKEFDYTQLTEDVLRDVSERHFNAQDIKAPRSFARFIVRLAELSPRIVLKQIVLLQQHLDSEAYTMRNAMIETLGLLIRELATVDDLEGENENHKAQVEGFFELLMDRFLDNNSYVRSKVISVFSKLVELPTKFPKQRAQLIKNAVRHLEDKSSSVRKNAIALVTKLVLTHPYGMLHGGRLNLTEWEERLAKVAKELEAIEPRLDEGDNLPVDEEEAENENVKKERGAEEEGEGDDDDADSVLDGDDSDRDSVSDGGSPRRRRVSAPRARGSNAAAAKPRKSRKSEAVDLAAGQLDADRLTKLRLTKKYYTDAIAFIRQIEAAVHVLADLLVSTNKSEALEAIEFFRVAHEYGVESSEIGIRKMLHLIWTKDNAIVEDGKEVKGIRSRLIDTYKALYFDPLPDPDMTAQQQVNRIAKNMIELTFNATLAELTSLEQLMSTIMSADGIHHDVINKLWQVYSVHKDIPKAQRRGAIIILGMLAIPKSEIINERRDLLLKIGLGPLGKADLGLARYTCIALQRLSGSVKKVKGSLADTSIRLPMSEPLFRRLQEAIETPTDSKAWFGMAEQAINTIYLLGEQPDLLCDEMIKNMTAKAFATVEPADTPAAAPSPEGEESSAPAEDDGEPPVTQNSQSSAREDSLTPAADPVWGNAFRLSQLIFTVGHVAIRHIVHLELVEREYKRRKAEADKEKAAAGGKAAKTEELDQVAGNAEDDIGDGMAAVRERELLYGPDSLLAVYGPMTAHICTNPKQFPFPMLRTAATLSLSKFMCVSSRFCEEHLLLLFKMLETAKDPTIRSNIVIALGDIAVCFSNIIDENSDRLYAGLADKDLLVKKNTLMVLTHLILNGMIKVKGQLGEMAKCLEDEETRISDLAKLFFTELSTKDNAVYNNLPDIISHLSVGKHAVDEEVFKSTMKFIFTFIEKEKQAENIVEKLCQRFRLATDERQWRDVAFCLSLLPFKSERSMKKLIEGLPFYQDKLHEDTVFKRFSEILVKARSNKASKSEADLKEFESILENAKTQGEEDKELATRAEKSKTRASARQAAKGTRRTRRKAAPPSDDEEDDE